MACSLEVDCAQGSPVTPFEVKRVHDAEGSMQSLGGVEASGSLVRTPIPSVIVPECVVKCMSGASVLKCASGVRNMACVSACVELVHGPIQTRDMNGEPRRPQRVNLATVSCSHV